ncbi:MAG: hypothetical protein RR410_05625 [Alistipes sp.]
MIKKLIGLIVAVAVVVIIVVAALRRDNFQSMELRDGIMDQTFPTPVVPVEDLTPAIPAPGSVEITDSVTLVVTDSL